MALQTYAQQVRQVQAPTAGVAQAAANQANATIDAVNSFFNVAKAGASLYQVEEKIDEVNQIKTSTKEAVDAVQTGDLSYREGTAPSTEQYNKIIATGREAQLQNDASYTINQLALQYANEPEMFVEESNKFIEGVVGREGNSPEEAASAKMYLEKVTSGYTTKLAENKFKLQKEEYTAQVVKNLTVTSDEMANNARNGDPEVAAQLYADLSAKSQQLVNEGAISPQQRVALLTESENRIITQSILGEFDEASENGADVAEKYLNKLKTERIEGMSPEDTDRILGSLEADVNALRNKELRAAKADIAANKLQNELFNQSVVVSTAASTGVPLDYKNKEDKKAANAVFDSQTGNWNLADPAQQQAAVDFSNQTGVVPDKVISKVRTAMYAGNPESAIAGAELVNRMVAENPAMMNQFTESDVSFALGVSRLHDAGVPIEEALQLQREFLKTPVQERQKAAKAAYSNDEWKEHITSQAESLISQHYDPSWLVNEPEMNMMFRSDYELIYSKYLGVTGNVDDAAKMANNYMQNKWSVTYDEDSNAVLMPYSPEKVLANTDQEVEWIQADKNETFSMINEDLRKRETGYTDSELDAQIAAATPDTTGMTLAERQNLPTPPELERLNKIKATREERGVEKYNISLVADERTIRGEKPMWAVFYTDKNGIQRPYINDKGEHQYWTASYKDSEQYKNEKAALEKKVDFARKQDEQKRVLEKLGIGAKNKPQYWPSNKQQ